MNLRYLLSLAWSSLFGSDDDWARNWEPMGVDWVKPLIDVQRVAQEAERIAFAVVCACEGRER